MHKIDIFYCVGHIILLAIIDSIYEDAATKLFSNQSISKKHIYFSVPILSMILAPHNEMFVVPRKTKSLCKITMPLKDKGTVSHCMH